MQFALNAYMQKSGEEGYVAWIDHSPKLKMIVSGKTPEETSNELMTSLRVTLSYILGFEVSFQELSEEQFRAELSKQLQETGSKEIRFLAA